ncbi:ATP-binding response regulator [Novosphingobium terrae]|uniref:ATP-binding response regulator n=1 Tax=Novosphingobium terrae TaxID=2726189 RepID=UPI00197CD911|nr:hybrid sensor histidine kinase/response regulator [Novosphingobium terrae]
MSLGASATAHRADTELEHNILVGRLKLIHGMLRNANASTLLLSLLIAGFLHSEGAPVLWWLGWQIFSKVAQVIDLKDRVSDELIEQAPKYYTYRLILWEMPQAIGWCSLYFIIPATSHPAECFIVLISLAGVVAAASTTYGPHFGVLASYLAVYYAAVGLAVAMAGGQMPDYLAETATVIVLYITGMGYNGYKNAAACRSSILLGLANASLARKLEQEAASARAAHAIAAEANEARSRFLTAVGHDLRQPMQAIALFLATLDSIAERRLRLRMIGQAQEALKGASEMLDMLLDFSRFETGISAQKRIFPLQDLFNHLEIEIAGSAETKNLVYRTRDTTALINSDPVLLHSILRNLLSNAVRYTHEGGVLIGARRRAGELVIEVWDTGQGIADDQHEAIFEEFRQLDDTSHMQRQGLGLGLAIVRRLASVIGAQVSLESRIGRGSVFRLAMPQDDTVALPRLPEVPVPSARDHHHGGAHILMVDDDPAIREAMTTLLQLWGHECRSAASGDEAMSMIARMRPDLLLCDLQLADGETASDILTRMHQAYGPIPTIILTGEIHLEEAGRLIAQGIEVLGKPVSEAQLRASLEQLLGHREDLHATLIQALR